MSKARIPAAERLERVERQLWRGQSVDPIELADVERQCRRILEGPDRGRTLRALAAVTLGRITKHRERIEATTTTTANADPSHFAAGGSRPVV